MKVVIAGGNGFLGSALVKELQLRGDQVVLVGRKDFAKGCEHLAMLMEGSRAVINLCGAPIIKRWSEGYKVELRKSRIDTTRLLVEALGKTKHKIDAFVCANAVGRYASTGCHDEYSTSYGDDFLAHLCEEWEKEALKAQGHSMRSNVLRFGVILGANGGALSSMLPLFKLGLGGVIGDGKQPFSWIHQDDLVGMILKCIDDEGLQGVYNGVAPQKETNESFSRTLARTLGKSLFFPVPAVMLKLIYGEGSVVLTSGQCAIPKRMLDAGYVFKYATLDKALQASL